MMWYEMVFMAVAGVSGGMAAGFAVLWSIDREGFSYVSRLQQMLNRDLHVMDARLMEIEKLSPKSVCKPVD